MSVDIALCYLNFHELSIRERRKCLLRHAGACYILTAAANYTIVCCAAKGGYKIIDFSGQYERRLCGAAAPMSIAHGYCKVLYTLQ